MVTTGHNIFKGKILFGLMGGNLGIAILYFDFGGYGS